MPITLVRPSQINHVPLGSNLIAIMSENNIETTITNTTVETQVYSFTIPAGTMGANDVIGFDTWGDMTNSSGATDTITMRVKLGGTTILALAFGVNTGTVNPMLLRGVIKNTGVTNAQRGSGIESCANGATTQFGTATIDMTVAQPFVITFQHGTANANNTYVHRLSQLSYIPAT